MWSETRARWRSRLVFASMLGLSAVLAAVSPSAAVQLVYEPFTIGDGPGEYHVGPLPGQPNPPIGPLATEPFFNGPWVGSDGPAGQVVQGGSIGPQSTGGSVTASGDGRAGRIRRHRGTTAPTARSTSVSWPILVPLITPTPTDWVIGPWNSGRPAVGSITT